MSAVKRAGASGPGSRRYRARATRGAISRAAFELFCERGYTGTTIEEIAVRAGVATQTVYFTFHSKSALLSSAYDLAVGGDPAVVPTEQHWYRAMVDEPDVTRAVGDLVGGVGAITRRLTPLYVVARGTAASEPEVAKVVDMHERWRVEGYLGMIDVLRAKRPLRRGLTRRRANELLLLFAGMDVYYFLVTQSGWRHDAWVGWTVRTLMEQLFGKSGS